MCVGAGVLTVAVADAVGAAVAVALVSGGAGALVAFVAVEVALCVGA